MNQYYVIGNPVQHSLSPEIFTTLFRTHHIDANYKAFLANDEQAFTELISKKNLFKGANITAPFKKTAYSAVDQLDASARHNKSVNCIKIINSTRVGFNTDEYCFNKMIEYNNLSLNNQNILILGTGGIVRTIINCINSKFQSNIYIFGREVNKVKKIIGDFNQDENSIHGFGSNINEKCVVINCLPIPINKNATDLIFQP